VRGVASRPTGTLGGRVCLLTNQSELPPGGATYPHSVVSLKVSPRLFPPPPPSIWPSGCAPVDAVRAGEAHRSPLRYRVGVSHAAVTHLTGSPAGYKPFPAPLLPYPHHGRTQLQR
jgi:hypothetical protein